MSPSGQATSIPGVLPPELECLILQDAARADRETALTLTLVSRRSQLWIEQIIYAMVTLDSSCPRHDATTLFTRTIKSRPAKFFATHVKSLCLTYNIERDQARAVPPVRTGIVDLAYWLIDPSPLLSVAPFLQLRRLSTRVKNLFTDPQNSELARQFFKHITHLELIDQWQDWTSWTGFNLLHGMTHVRLDFDNYITKAASPALRALSDILSSCRCLQVCLLLTFGHRGPADLLGQLDDRRIVLMNYHRHVANWEGLILGDRSQCRWLQAEDIISAR